MVVRSLTAKYADYDPEFPPQEMNSAQKAGIKFEKAVARRLSILHENVKVGPWLVYNGRLKKGICQPDILVWLNKNLLCVVECKLSWKRAARGKLVNFYGPILQAIHPDVKLCYLQVYKNSRRGCHKRTLLLSELETLKPGQYKECQHLT